MYQDIVGSLGAAPVVFPAIEMGAALARGGRRRDRSGAGGLRGRRLADLVVLPADILTIPEKQIEGLKPVATMVGGRFVYSDPAVRLE